jgi:threonine/homoserine/homoserine lactone efflux protein
VTSDQEVPLDVLARPGIVLLALFALSLTPGPGVAAVLARVLAHGEKGLAGFILGFVVGDLVWFALAASGMATLARTAHSFMAALKYLGAAYLLYMAFRMWTAPVRPIAALEQGKRQRPAHLFIASLTLTLGNPKVMLFFLALLPTVLDLTLITLVDSLKIGGSICIILSVVFGSYSLAAMRVRTFFSNPRSLRWLNRGSGTVMAGAAVAVAATR